MDQPVNRCSFCGKKQSEVKRLIAGPGGVAICDQCVALCNEVLAHDAEVLANSPQAPGPSKSPSGWVRQILHRSP